MDGNTEGRLLRQEAAAFSFLAVCLEQIQEKCVTVFRSELRKNKYLERFGDSMNRRTALRAVSGRW
ncbi:MULTISPECIES: hypothetical protein [unclassified Mesorhizobium]|uniref:hypothetical protein n=2 Tax=Mesorhizobium TaxID=68287 RepID=UPI000F760BC6|nr:MULTISPECIES: hypothetical protein [unclassified Mesorhizobium]AZO72906.1 hypothetical protein EJ067_18275 [Mesorhizobium sp. M1D.F.Ca.ET.043.01.1.1]RWA90786.1 MAG: hypothetical protein EOQ32_18075 [Mesorhizobium sp.]